MIDMLQGLNHLTLSVSCLETSFNFYTQILGCKPLAKWKQGAYLLAGDLWLCLAFDPCLNPDVSSDYTHIAFSVAPESFKKHCQDLEQHNLQLWQENSSEGDSLYILDPDNHKLELHVGNWQTRLEATKKNPYEDMTFYDVDEIS